MAKEQAAPSPEIMAEIEKYQEVMRKDPRSLSFARLAEAYRRGGMTDDAILICQEGLKNHPHYATGRVVLARAFKEKGDLKGAEAEFQKVLKDAPDNVLALRSLADIWEAKGELKKAMTILQELKRQHPKDEEIAQRIAHLDEEMHVDPAKILQDAERYPAHPTPPPAMPPKEKTYVAPPPEEEIIEEAEIIEPEEVVEEAHQEEPPHPAPSLRETQAVEKESAPVSHPPLTPEDTGRWRRSSLSQELKAAMEMLDLIKPEDEDKDEEVLVDLDMATETIADLYFQQGHLERALLIYARLKDKDPDDEIVKRKVEEIKVQLPNKRVEAVQVIFQAWQNRQKEMLAENLRRTKLPAQIMKLEHWLTRLQGRTSA